MNPLRYLAPLLLAVALALPASSAFARPSGIVIGTMGQSFQAVTAALVQEVLASLGHDVEVIEATREECFELLAKGDVDLLVAAWLPGADAGLRKAHEGALVEVTTLYREARLVWAVPASVPESAVLAIADLLKPEVAARMVHAIRVDYPGSSLAQATARTALAYVLAAGDYRVEPTAAGGAVAAFLDDYAQHRWAVIPLTRPHWLHKALPLRVLEDPRGTLGGEDRAALLAWRGTYLKLPQRTLEVLERIHLDVSAVEEMDYAVNVDNKSPAEAAREWMSRNAETVRLWTE